MEKITTKDLMRMVGIMTDVIIANEVPFCELDSHAGDGDFGMSLAKGFKEVKKAWGELPTSDIGAFLKAAGMIITEHCGGASGPIWGSAFRAAGKSTDGQTEIDMAGLAALMQAAVDGIQKRGGAKLGDKTLLDALIPTTEALKAAASAGMDLKKALAAGAKAAIEGAEATKLITATKGRASYVGERSLSHPDAGATALGIIFSEIASAF
jgi:dihydroxyacetone kinase